MLSKTLPDGTVIQFCYSDTYSGPNGAQGCQRTSRNCIWWRVDGGTWSPTAHRNGMKFLEWLECSQNLEDFLSGEE